MKTIFIISCFFVAASFVPICAAQQTAATDKTAQTVPVLKPGDKGTVIYNGEFEFQPPPSPWELIKGNESTTYVFGFYRKDPGKIALESTFFAYDEEPYGYSRKLEDRAEEFLKRFFWASHVKVTVLERKTTTPVLGGEGMTLVLEGKDPVKKHKVKSKVIFGKRGERVVAFYINQWRTFESAYDQSAFDIFDKFAGSFRFLKKSFYEEL